MLELVGFSLYLDNDIYHIILNLNVRVEIERSFTWGSPRVSRRSLAAGALRI
jgi:hypothetical protein